MQDLSHLNKVREATKIDEERTLMVEDIPNYNCIVCGMPTRPDCEGYGINSSVEHSGFEDAIAFIGTAGFGSRLDTSTFLVIVCDTCLKKSPHSVCIYKGI